MRVLQPVGSLLLAAPLAKALLSLNPTSCTLRAAGCIGITRLNSTSSSDAVSSLPRLLDSKGNKLSEEKVAELLNGKRVAYYFAAGWCPMCTSFEQHLLPFQQAAKTAGKDLELIYVPSDRTEEAALKRSASYQMLSVPLGDDADQLKREYKIWSGSESVKLGFGRRSGVPALVVLDGEKGEEMAFLAAEAQGVGALRAWPLDDLKGIW